MARSIAILAMAMIAMFDVASAADACAYPVSCVSLNVYSQLQLMHGALCPQLVELFQSRYRSILEVETK